MGEVALIPIDDQALIESLKGEFTQIVESAQNFVIASPENLEQATDMVKVLKNGRKRLESRRTELKAPHLEAGSVIDTNFKKVIILADGGIKSLTEQQTQYHLKEEARLEKEEVERREREAAKIEEERENLAELAAVSGGEVDIELESDSLDKREDQLHVDTGAPKSVSRGNIGSSSLRRDWTFDVLDITKVPARYLLINAPAVNSAIKKIGTRNIPGLKIYQKPTSVTR